MNAPKDVVGDFIVKMKSETTHAKLNQQLYAIPKLINGIINEQVFEYYVSDRKRQIVNPAIEVCLSIDDVKFFSMISRTYRALQDSRTPIIDLIEYHRIYPIMLFINGKFIPWENIDLIVSFEKYYLMIHDMEDEFIKSIWKVNSADILLLPSNIYYSIGVNSSELTQLFAFNSEGLLDFENWERCIYIESSEIDMNIFEVSDKLIEFKQDDKYKYFKQNFFTFRNGLFDSTTDISIIGGFAYIHSDDLEGLTCLFMANPKCTETLENLNHANYDNIKTDMMTLLQDYDNAPDYIKTLYEDIEFSMDTVKSYEDNRKEALEYIMQYRQDLFTELYEQELNYFAIQVNFEWLTSHLNEDGYLSLPRRSSTGKDYYIIILVNGCLYQYYKHHSYNTNKFICPITSIESTDKVEILFFKNASEYNILNKVNNTDDYMPLSEKYYNENAKIFCKETSDDYFTFPDDGDQHFPVPFALTTDGNGNSKIVFEDDFYYGKDVTITPDNTFKYYGYIMTDETVASYKVSLGTKFMYCNEYDRYVIFRNGRRLTNDFYRLTIPCRTTTPFYRFEIYLAIPLEAGDRLDVFYLPTKVKDIDLIIDMPEDGKITIDKTLLPYIASDKNYTYWINGKKIPMNDIKQIDGNTIQIMADQESTTTLRVTVMGDAIDEIETIYQSIDTSLWDKAISESDYTSILGISLPEFTNTESNTYTGNVPIESIMWELIREHYMSNELVDITGAFIYDYLDVDQSAIMEDTDNGGNTIIDAYNSERRDNLDIDRYYP